MSAIFDKMIQDLSLQDGEKLLDDCMSFQPKAIAKVPLRYRLIALGFVNRLSLEELNEKLKDEGCEQLYARNTTEAVLIYAFANRLSYKEWKRLHQKSQSLLEEESGQSGWFGGGSVTYAELADYVAKNSQSSGDVLRTRKLTQYLQAQIRQIKSDEERFWQFLIQNQEDFSRVREKARYYFCKYLCHYLEQKTDRYLEAKRSHAGAEQAAPELFVFKSAAKLRKKGLTEEEVRRTLRESAISFGNLYDAFNHFYFDYVSSDWIEILLDYYGNIESLDTGGQKELARALRAYEPKWKKLGDQEVLRETSRRMAQREAELDRQYSREDAAKGYQKNRAGEKAVRNYIKGVLDIDRTTLICYLLFFADELTGREECRIDQKRLNEILGECGFAGLRDKDEFDGFILGYLEADDRVDYLMETVTEYALQDKNSFLYHMYRESVSNDALNRKILE